MNPIKLFKKFKIGLKNLTIAQQLHAKLAGLWGNIIGMCCGTITMIIYVIITGDFKWWWSAIILMATAYLNIIDLIGTTQQYKQACEIQDILNKNGDNYENE